MSNLESIIDETGAKEILASARIYRSSKMIYKNFKNKN